MKATTKTTIKWLASLAVALVVISLILVPQVLKVESRAANVDTPTYTANTSWYSSAGTYTLTTPQEVLGFFQLLADGTTFSGSTIQLGCDIDLNPGVNLQMTYIPCSWLSDIYQTQIGVATVLPSVIVGVMA